MLSFYEKSVKGIMRNRAKCKLCKDILESFHEFDLVACSCDEISISGGSVRFECGAKDWKNFLRLDDTDKEFQITVKDKNEDSSNSRDDIKDNDIGSNRVDLVNISNDSTFVELDDRPAFTKQDLLSQLDMMIKNIESLPQHAMTLPINHYDFASLMILLSSILRAS